MHLFSPGQLNCDNLSGVWLRFEGSGGGGGSEVGIGGVGEVVGGGGGS